MKKFVAFLACFLATLVLGFADLQLPPTDSCAASGSCCCSDPATVDPCVCGDPQDFDLPAMAGFGGMPHPAAPPAEGLLVGEIEPLTALARRWHPALPWHAPPQEKRARLAIWIL